MHYEFTEEELHLRGMTAYRIRATVDMPNQDVKIGDLGGFVCKNSILSPKAWVGGDASVWDSILEGDIRVDDDSRVEKSTLRKKCQILEYATIFHSVVAGVYATGEVMVRESKLILQNSNDFAFYVEENTSLASCTIIYTASEKERFTFKGNTQLTSCTITGKRMEFKGDTTMKYSTIQGEALFFEDIDHASSLQVDGRQFDLKGVKELFQVTLKGFLLTLNGTMSLKRASISGEEINLRGDGITIEDTKMLGNLINIRDSVNLKEVEIQGYAIDLSDYVSLVGRSANRIQVKHDVAMMDLVKVHTKKGQDSMGFRNEVLRGDILLTGTESLI